MRPKVRTAGTSPRETSDAVVRVRCRHRAARVAGDACHTGRVRGDAARRHRGFGSRARLMADGNFYALAASRFPADVDSTCIETADGSTYTWRDLHAASGRIANWLASLRLPAGARVAVQVEKSPEWASS